MTTRRAVLAAAAVLATSPSLASEPGTARGAWVAEEIAGTAVAGGAATLEIGADGAVSGSGGCNRYRGRAEIAAGTIAFSPLAATRMACPGAAMEQEGRFLAALAAARRFRFEDGRLVLSGEDGAVVARLRRAG